MGNMRSAALPIAYVLLRLLVVLNWLMAAVILVLLFAIPTERWIMSSLHLTPSREATHIVMGLRAIAAIGLAMIPLNHIILTRLIAMVETVRLGDPFVRANAGRLRAIAWAMLGLQLLGLVIWLITEIISSPAHPIDIDAGLSIPGWLAVLLTFVLSRVFAEGALMREDLEGTI